MKNVIFDFGNVLVKYEPERIYAEHFGDEARAWWFLRHVITPEWRNRIDAGESHEACINELTASMPDYAEAIEVYRSHWREMLTGEMPGMREVIDDLKRWGVEIYGLTNWSMETFPEARQRFGILQQIDRYVVSGAEGLVKPDHRLFQRLLDRYGLRAEDCIFVDDNEANVEAARTMGMEGIQFRSADDLRDRLHLYKHLDDKQIATLSQQGNRAADWGTIEVCPGTDLGCIWDCRLGRNVRLGLVASLCNSRIEDCTIGDGTTIEDVRLLKGYTIGSNCTISNVGELSYGASGQPVAIDVMNENGGRSLHPCAEMTVGDAYLYARFRDRAKVMAAMDRWSAASTLGMHGGYIGDGTTIRNATAVVDGMVGPSCEIGHGVIAERFLLGENVKLEAGLRLNDTVVGDNSTVARGEVGCSLIFPAHEQHHNNSFLIAALVQGQSNVPAGATLGSNHNGRTADGEISAGRGFWPALCTSIKHNCRFASYTLLAKGDYPAELNITLPFSLVNNNVARNRLEVMPAYWWMYNMYALDRNRTKFAKRDRRHLRRQHIVFDPLAPDTAEEMLMGRSLLRMWTAKAYQDGGATEVQAYGMERGHRKTVILKPADGFRAYEEMLIYYAMQHLDGTEHYDTPRIVRWHNIGGQLVAGPDLDSMLEDIERGTIDSWQALHKRLDSLWDQYPEQVRQHAYATLCEMAQKKQLDADDWGYYRSQYARIQQLVVDRIRDSRQKDADNEFRQTTFLNTAEMRAVLGQ